VVASQNNHRPPNVVTYSEGDAADLRAKLVDLTKRYMKIKEQTRLEGAEDNIARTVDWLLAQSDCKTEKPRRDLVHAS